MANSLTELSRALAEVVEMSAPGVVRVEGRRRRPSSGVVISADLVATANHAIEREEEILVSAGAEEGHRAELVGRDPGTDLALLRVSGGALAAPAWADAAPPSVGHLAIAVGRPGRTARAALGIIGASAEGWRNPAGSRLDRYLELDARLPHGFSGGAALDAAGALVGVVTSGLVPGAPLVVPIASVRQVAEVLTSHGRIRRGYLGIGSHPVRLQGASSQAARAEVALLVYSVEPGGPAEKGGVLLGDALLSIDGVSLAGIEDLLSTLSADRVGREVPVRVLRGGEVVELKLTVGERR